ncbi:hypothetical protein PVAP13_9KG050800 [Panicum virgatum]|uniref:Uncharacterized protein n=1 Tax=Panicum virgatum TaxID=38727 RepID=A0A8T0NFB7_PANVG|nr:hypothetical protein PVAP13_9KG050800 [Panicum virgatum]
MSFLPTKLPRSAATCPADPIPAPVAVSSGSPRFARQVRCPECKRGGAFRRKKAGSIRRVATARLVGLTIRRGKSLPGGFVEQSI